LTNTASSAILEKAEVDFPKMLANGAFLRDLGGCKRLGTTMHATTRLLEHFLAALSALALAIPSPHVRAQAVVDASTLRGKVLFGYQGWFACAGDGSSNSNWRSWARGTPAAETLTIDMYPDLRELDPDELYPVPNMTIGGKPAFLYSANNRKTVLRHFQWMKEYGLDGVLVQRFVGSIRGKRNSGDIVLKNVMAGAEKFGRTFAIEYDITGGNPDTFFQTLRDDWQYLVDELKVTAHPNYLHHNGKPVLSIWGMGLEEDRHVPRDPEMAGQVIEWFKTKAPKPYQVTYMGGTPSRWRTLTNDCRKDPRWTEAFRMMDVIQPWTVGRYRDNDTADQWKSNMLRPDLAWTAANGPLYMPVIFPGFSWHNLKREAPKNAIPRNRGEFLWRQAFNAKEAGAVMLKIAMFDEVNESTAMFKLAARRNDSPDQGYWLTLDADGYELPSDWYLRVAGEITRMFHGEVAPTPNLPEKLGPPRKTELEKPASMAALTQENPARADASGKLCLWSDRPAKTWMTEALPIGNGPLGAMLFGGTEVERVQFNEISLWSGTRMAVEGLDDEGQDMGAYQAFGDILIHLGHDFSKVTDYRQELDIDRAVHQVTYEYNGVRYQRTAFASHHDGVIVIHLTANKPAAYTGRVQLADMHQARIAAAGNTLSSVGRLENGFEYEAQLLVLNENGAIAVKNDDACAKNPWAIIVPATSLAFDQCDSVTLILGASTNFLQDHTKQWLGEHPHAAVTKRVDAAA